VSFSKTAWLPEPPKPKQPSLRPGRGYEHRGITGVFIRTARTMEGKAKLLEMVKQKVEDLREDDDPEFCALAQRLGVDPFVDKILDAFEDRLREQSDFDYEMLFRTICPDLYVKDMDNQSC
jgi:hypothetical protein